MMNLANQDMNNILVRRRNIVLWPYVKGNSESATSKAMVLSIMKNMESLGYTLDKELFTLLVESCPEVIEEFYWDVMPVLKNLTGADKRYNPMYPNFPSQVMEADIAELICNAVVHYWSFGTLMPEYAKDERMPLFDNVKLTALSAGTFDDLKGICGNLIVSKTNLSEQDKKDIATIAANIPTVFYDSLPDEIPLKENVAFVGKIILTKASIKNADAIKKYYKTATDVLRLVVALSDGDISLAKPTKFRSLRRYERRMIMDLLVECGPILEDMFRYQYEWIRVGEIVHPGEFSKIKKYLNVCDAFRVIRNEHKPLFVSGQIQGAILSHNTVKAVELLATRPGEFARQLDKLLRDCQNEVFTGDVNYYTNLVIKNFRCAADKVSIPVLLQVRQHFMDRNKDNLIRVFFPKGNVAKAMSIPNTLLPISENVCKAIVGICDTAIVEQLQHKEFMGNVYIDPDMKNYLVPFNQRSASTGSKMLVRGSHIPLNNDAKAVRGFIWWTNTNADGSRWSDGLVDIDLSAAVFDEDWNYVEHVSYTRLKSGGICHSGDITNGGPADGKGVAEFLDADIDYVAAKGRYLVYQVYSYTGQHFSQLPNVRFGWMERQDTNSGEIFEPSTVDMRIDMNTDSTVAIPVIFDCVKKEFIWCDMNLDINRTYTRYHGNNLESNLTGVSAAGYAMTHLSKPDLYTLIMLNVRARGLLVSDRAEADIIFSNDTTKPAKVEDILTDDDRYIVGQQEIEKDVPIITAFDTDYIVGKLL